jgi:serine/threonine protein kinase
MEESEASFGGQEASSTAGVDNPRWLAPEVLTGHRPTRASDVFSFGVVMWELLTWELPWSGVLNKFKVRQAPALQQKSWSSVAD